MDYEMSKHARDMLAERSISKAWAEATVAKPDWIIEGSDENTHFYRSVPEHGGRILHVVFNNRVKPGRVVTVYFDRRARRP